jgi:hypothetical protein
VNFVGSPNPDGTWDTGGLRFDNTTSSPITLDHVTVDIGSSHFDPGWTNVVVPANGTAVLAASGQLTSGLPTGKGGIYITGHDPDYHGYQGPNAAGAQHILQGAVNWVTFGKATPKMLLVTDLNNPGLRRLAPSVRAGHPQRSILRTDLVRQRRGRTCRPR